MHSGILILSSAFLLFLIQPVLGKDLLPKWGGTANVWTSCLLFFQTALLVGYLYASKTHRSQPLRAQASMHAGLWAMSLALLPALAWWPTHGLNFLNIPSLAIPLELSIRIGLPFVLLASTSSLISTWHYQTTQTHHPYALYALANISSLAGCLIYPIAVEPWISSPMQLTLWMSLYCVLALGMIFYCLSIRAQASQINQDVPIHPASTQPQHQWLIIGLSACSSIVLAATTGQASQAGVIVPGLWVLPLAVYLATWWLAFSAKIFQSWSSQLLLFYAGALFGLSAVVLKLLLAWPLLIGFCLACVACVSLSVHGLIYRLRPTPESMPWFYLRIAMGGALGSLFASTVAPWCFSDYYELHAGLALGAILLSWYHARAMSEKLYHDPLTRRLAWPLTILCPLLLLGAISMLLLTPSVENLIDKKRDFYGVVSVIENDKQGLRAMLHGRIRHGTQPIDGPLTPDRTTYYQTDSGAALAFGWCHSHFNRPLNIAIIGLGTGSLSLYAKSQDSIRYYEISPAVCDMASKHFGYLNSHSGSTEIILGDGRKKLQAESLEKNPPKYNLVVVDAFANDSLPIHLLTVQALELYRDCLVPEGVIAMNITNRNMDLAPILFATSKLANRTALLVESKFADDEPESRRVRWLLLFPPEIPLPAWPGSRTKLAPSQDTTNVQSLPIQQGWTDQFASPFHALRW